jgi:uncharacterized protein (UPF0548 family)
LSGHPACGEESFLVEITADGSVTANIRAFSRPASFLARIAGPIGRRAQSRATESYLSALVDVAMPT